MTESRIDQIEDTNLVPFRFKQLAGITEQFALRI